jgi:hypothetical protein
MKMEEDDILVAYHDGSIYRFRRSRKQEFSWFGGPCDDYPCGIEHGPQPLHHLATLWGHHLPFLLEHYVFELPLFYGFCFDGCRLRYRLGNKRPQVELVELDPTDSNEDFPYRNYPITLPYYPLAPTEPTPASEADFLEMLHQPFDISAEELVVMVPSQFGLGVSLWGPHGDAEEVQTVFRVDLKQKIVEGFNMCT